MGRLFSVFKRAGLPVFLVLLLFTAQAHAQVDSANLLDNILARYQAAASAWAGVITARATWLFWTLVVISMVWTFGFMALRKADIGDFFAEFIRFTIFTGFFWWLLINGPNFANSIITSMRQLGSQATGLPSTLSPSGIVDIGFEIFFRVVDRSSAWAPVDSAVGILMSLGILIVLVIIGVNMVLLLTSGWVLAYGGVFFLGFGGSRWTSDMAINYYKTVLSVGTSLFAMVLLVGVGRTFLDDYYARMSAGVSLKEMAVLLVATVVLFVLTNKVPAMLAGIITGSAIGNNAGIGGAGAAFGMGAAAMAAAGVATGGAAIMAGATQMAGGASAVMAAISKASDNMASSSGAFAPGGGGGGGGGGGDSSGAGGGSTVASALGAAMGDGGGSAGTGAAMSFGGGSGPGAGSEAAGEASGGSAAPSGGGSGGGGQSGEGTSGDTSPEASAAASAAAGGGSPGATPPSPMANAARSLKSAAATAGKFAADVGSNLAQGVGAVGKQKVGAAMAAAQERIGETFGGQVAAHIKASGSAGEGATGEPSFGGDSLSAGGQGLSAEAKSEVDQFVNKQS